jgi:large subunit ribosomal protein L21
MEAIIRDSGRQFKVKEGGTIEVDYRDLVPGSTVEFKEVLYVGGSDSPARVGRPLVEGALVVGKVIGKLGPKLIVAEFRRRKNSRRRIGHRQKYTKVQIERIQL